MIRVCEADYDHDLSDVPPRASARSASVRMQACPRWRMLLTESSVIDGAVVIAERYRMMNSKVITKPISIPTRYRRPRKEISSPCGERAYHANVACRNAIEETIRQNFDGMHLKKDCLEPVLAEYGYKRTEWVLATTLQELSWDGRFSRSKQAVGGAALYSRRTSGITPRSPSEVTPPYWMAS